MLKLYTTYCLRDGNPQDHSLYDLDIIKDLKDIRENEFFAYVGSTPTTPPDVTWTIYKGQQKEFIEEVISKDCFSSGALMEFLEKYPTQQKNW